MTRFLLIRHGHTSWIGQALAGHTPGVGLSETGRQQALAVSERLRGCQIAAIYSSPLQRTLETAEPLARVHGLTVVTRPRLMEVDFGTWTGRKMAELEADPLWQRFNAQRSITRAPGGELMLEVQTRMVNELEELRQLHRGDTVVAVSHQDSIKAVIAHYAGIPLELFSRFEIHPGSVSIVNLADWGPQIVAVNNTAEI